MLNLVKSFNNHPIMYIGAYVQIKRTNTNYLCLMI